MDAMKQPIESIKISSSPIASQNTMDQYKIYKVGEIQSLMHAIVFNKNMKKIFGNQNRLFMIMADGEKIYIGEYWANFMNTVAPDIMMYPYKDNEFHILSNDEGANRINDNRIISCITESGIKLTYY